jgi:hypothetical protein
MARWVKEEAGQIGREKISIVLFSIFVERPRNEDASVIDQRVDTPEAIQGGVNHAPADPGSETSPRIVR